MEIYKDLSNPASQEFEKLLNSQLSKIKIEEGKIIEGKINKITEKFVFLFVEGLKSEPVLDINELKTMGLSEKIKLGETISVLLEKIEDKNGVLFSIAYWIPYKNASPSAAAMEAPKKSKSDATAVILILLIDPHTTIIPQSIPVFFLALFNLSL